MVVWGAGKQSWRMRWNAEADAGVEGALRADYGKGYAVGSSDLRDGRWHHAALVFIGAEPEKSGKNPTKPEGRDAASSPADVATHMRLYVDGKLESLSGGRSERVVSTVSREEDGLSTFSLGGGGSFEGWLDEFYLLETAASPTTILKLYEQGVPLVDGKSKAGAAEAAP